MTRVLEPDLLVKFYWRVGRKVGRTIYAELKFGQPSDDDPVIGMMDTPALAKRVVHAHNCLLTGEEVGDE